MRSYRNFLLLVIIVLCFRKSLSADQHHQYFKWIQNEQGENLTECDHRLSACFHNVTDVEYGLITLSDTCGADREAVDCLQSEMKSGTCTQMNEESANKLKTETIAEKKVNIEYVCETEFDKFSENDHCLVNKNASSVIRKTCLGTKKDPNHPDKTENCEMMEKQLKCLRSHAEGLCGKTAGEIMEELYRRLFNIIPEYSGCHLQ